MVFPDDLMTAVKIEAVHQRRKLNDLVPDLIRIGLATQRMAHAEGGNDSNVPRAQTWLEGWQKLGVGLEKKGASAKSCVALLEADRGNRG